MRRGFDPPLTKRGFMAANHFRSMDQRWMGEAEEIEEEMLTGLIAFNCGF
jgi:hypothetical protein